MQLMINIIADSWQLFFDTNYAFLFYAVTVVDAHINMAKVSDHEVKLFLWTKTKWSKCSVSDTFFSSWLCMTSVTAEIPNMVMSGSQLWLIYANMTWRKRGLHSLLFPSLVEPDDVCVKWAYGREGDKSGSSLWLANGPTTPRPVLSHTLYTVSIWHCFCSARWTKLFVSGCKHIRPTTCFSNHRWSKRWT